MSFSAGGANVKGVQQIEQGTLTLPAYTATNVTGTGDLDVTFTVPAGKFWVLKAYRGLISGGTLTVSNYSVILESPASNQISLYSSGTAPSANAFNTFTLPAGWKIKFRYTIGAWTSGGEARSTLCYQEGDV